MARVVETRNDATADTRDWALFSGGHDSAVAAHECMTTGVADAVLHIDTGIAIPDAQDYVRRVCDEHNWPLVVLASDFDYEEIVLENQFPGPGVHVILYSKLKERALRHIPRQLRVKPQFYTGVRRFESAVRFKNLDEPIKEAKQWVWRSPIHTFTRDDVEDYLQDHGLPRSPVKQKYHHSGECLCGCFGNRTEELTILEAHYPETAARIKELEAAVQAKYGTDDPKSYWAHGGMSSVDLRALLADNDETQMLLCASCENGIQQP